jgi:hypothetical protein
MNRIGRKFLTVCLALGLASAALAQQDAPRQPAKGQRQGQGFFGPGGLLLSPDVKKELKLTDDQASKVKEALEKVGDKHRGSFEKFRDMSNDERRKVMLAIREDTNKAIAGVLDAKQVKRFHQIEWQLSGPNALRDPELQKELQLSDEQKKKIDGIYADTDKKVEQLFQGGNPQAAGEKLQQLFKDTQDKVNGVLSDDQKKKMKETLGPRFELQPPPGAPGGRSR